MNKYYLRVMLREGENTNETLAVVSNLPENYIWVTTEDKFPVVSVIFFTDDIQKTMGIFANNIPSGFDTFTLMRI